MNFNFSNYFTIYACFNFQESLIILKKDSTDGKRSFTLKNIMMYESCITVHQ